MFTFAQLINVHLDLWPWLTFRGHVTITNVKIAYIFLMVREEQMVTMKHYWEVDRYRTFRIRKTIWPRMTLTGSFQGHESEKWLVSSKLLLVGPGCLLTKMFIIAKLIKVYLDLGLDWPLRVTSGPFTNFALDDLHEVISRSRNWKVHRPMWRLMPENGNHACNWTLRTPNLIPWPWP